VPNIILVLTDDQDLLLGSVDLMPATQKRLISEGVSASNHFTTTPVCCPSRSSIMTGRFPHNYPQRTDQPSGTFDGVTTCLNPDRDDLSLFPLLYNAGYRVGLFGKHMNKGGMTPYCPANKGSHGIMPKGITNYLALCPDTCYENCVFASGKEAGGATDWVQPTEHQGYGTAIIGNTTLDFIRESVADNKPFMVYVSPHAPHLPATPAPWYVGAPVGRGAPRTKAFGVASPDKHWIVAQQPPLTKNDEWWIDGVFQNRTRTLFSVPNPNPNPLFEPEGISMCTSP